MSLKMHLQINSWIQNYLPGSKLLKDTQIKNNVPNGRFENWMQRPFSS